MSELCGAEDDGYQLDPDQEPTRLGPCILPAGHYPETMHEAPQEWPGHPGIEIPNVRWGGSPKVVQNELGSFGSHFPVSSGELLAKKTSADFMVDSSHFKYVPEFSVEEDFGGLKDLHELVKRGRYFVQPDTDFGMFEEGLRYGCSEHLDAFAGGSQGSGQLDIVDILKWIEEHEYSHHQPVLDKNLIVPLTQIMTAYAQQGGAGLTGLFQDEKKSDKPPKHDYKHATCSVCGEDIWETVINSTWIHTRRDEYGHGHEASPKEEL